MNDQELNSRIKGAFTRATPDILDSIRSQCQEQKGTVIYMTQPNKKRSFARRFAAVAAALALVIAIGAGVGIHTTNNAVASTVSLDINPSVEIKVNRAEKVLAVNALNEDGRIVIGTMDFKGSSLDVTVNALIGSMLRNGYLSEMSNSILVSVNDDNSVRGQELEARLVQEIDTLLHTDTFDGAVLSQTISADAELETLAAQYGITTGKAQLIQQIVAQNTRYTFEDLVPLSINELNLISESGSLHLDNVSSTGTASEKAYVGRDAAKAAALTHAGVAEADVLRWDCELDFDDGRIIYEIEFRTAQREYDYDVNALTGEVIKREAGWDDDDWYNGGNNGNSGSSGNSGNSGNTGNSGNSYIGEDAAKAAALTHAGLTQSDVSRWECELDRDDGRVLYEIEFRSGFFEYSYDIDAYTGAVLRFDKDFGD